MKPGDINEGPPPPHLLVHEIRSNLSGIFCHAFELLNEPNFRDAGKEILEAGHEIERLVKELGAHAQHSSAVLGPDDERTSHK